MSRANTTFGGAATLRTVTAFRTFVGTDDRGAPVRVEARLRLDPSTGVLARPLVAPSSLPAPSVLISANGLAPLVGFWRGSYRVDGSLVDVPIAATIVADGTISIAENEPVTNRFSRKVQVKDGGLEYSGERERGMLQLHELAGRRMLVGKITQIEGPSYAVYLEAQAPASAAAPPASTLASPATPSGASTPPGGRRPGSVDLSGSYRGTVTGTRTDNSTYSTPVTVAMMQTGRELSGTWSTPSASGSLTGTVLDRSFTFRLRQESPCPAELSGQGAIDENGSRLAASYRGESCQGTGVTASIVVTRESP
jgi:hypothetical protein